MKYILAICCMMVATPALSQWHGWPSSNYYTMWEWRTNRFDQQCYSAIVERVQLVGVSTVPVPPYSLGTQQWMDNYTLFGGITNEVGAGYTTRVAVTFEVTLTNWFGGDYAYSYDDPMTHTSCAAVAYIPYTSIRAGIIDRNIERLFEYSGAHYHYMIASWEAAGTTNFNDYFAGGTQAWPRIDFAALVENVDGVGVVRPDGTPLFLALPFTSEPVRFFESTWNGSAWSGFHYGSLMAVGDRIWYPELVEHYSQFHYITNGPVAIPSIWVGLEGTTYQTNGIGTTTSGSNLITGVYTPATQYWFKVGNAGLGVLGVYGDGANTGDVIVLEFTNGYTSYGGAQVSALPAYSGHQDLLDAAVMDSRKAALDAMDITEGYGLSWVADGTDNAVTWAGTSIVSWAAAKTAAEANPSTSTVSAPPEAWSYGTFTAASTTWVARAYASQMKAQAVLQSLFHPEFTRDCEVDFYAQATLKAGYDTETYYPNGSTLLEDKYFLQSAGNLSVTGTTVQSSIAIGQKTLPSWCDAPADGDSQSKGYVANGLLAALRWHLLFDD